MQPATSGKLILIPLPVADGALHTLPAEVSETVAITKHYFAENARTARRFIKSLRPELVIESLQILEIDKHSGPDLKLLRSWLSGGHAVGVMSEAGCPAIADPGALLVAEAHKMGAIVQPLTGPSSIILALMASGLNGQSFAFQGYLPVKDPDRSARIRQLDAQSAREGQTQLFIETPYRNNAMLDDLLKHCSPNTKLCIAQNISAPDAFNRTDTIAGWKSRKPVLAKAPAVFLLLAG